MENTGSAYAMTGFTISEAPNNNGMALRTANMMPRPTKPNAMATR